MNRKLSTLLAALLGLMSATANAAAIAIPPEFALPDGVVDLTKPGFLVRPYQTTASQPNNLIWTEDQLLGAHGPNIADLTGADANGYYTIDTVVNWNIAGTTVHEFVAPDKFPGISTPTENFSMEVLTYLQFPAAGTYNIGVNSDDGFRLTTSPLNPKDRFSAVTLGELNGGRGAADSILSVSVSKAGIYPMRLLYEQGGGDAAVRWFTVTTDEAGAHFSLINDASAADSLKAYAVASIAPPVLGRFGHDPSGFSFTIIDQLSALNPATLKVKLNGTQVAVTTQKSDTTTTVSYAPASLVTSGSANTVSIQFSDDAAVPHALSLSVSYTEAAYALLDPAAALSSSAVDTANPGFLYRITAIDSGANPLAANVASAEAQLAGLLTTPDGTPYENTVAGSEGQQGFVLQGVINFNLAPDKEQGVLMTANGYADQQFPGLDGTVGNNLAGEIVAYLDLAPGFYNFGVTSADGFRLALASNPFEAISQTLGIFDHRRITTETRFGIAVVKAGLYPVRLVYFRQGNMADNGSSTGSLEFYTAKADGTYIAVGDTANPESVKAYWKRTAPYDPFVKYAGPTSFISPFNGPDVGFKTVNVVISNGSDANLDATTVALSIDGSAVAVTSTTAGSLTTLSHTPEGLQLTRAVHTALLTFKDNKGKSYSKTWSFNLLRNYVFPAPLSFEDFESTELIEGEATLPQGWTQENHTGHQTDGFASGDGNSDFYLGFVTIDKGMRGKKDGLSKFAPQEFNGVLFEEATTPLMAGHSVYAESDDRQNGPPGQIQYLFTPTYDLSGKAGIAIAFNSAYEQNQDNINGLEYTTDGGVSWKPVFYWIQDGNDSQGTTDILRDGQGNIDVSKTLLTSYGDVARYTNEISGELVGGYYGFFIKAPITPALAPYIEGRVNDDGSESKRVEALRIAGADNQKTVQFRFIQAGTSSWYWGIDNWGVYSVPSLVTGGLTTLNVSPLAAGKITLSWSGAGVLETSSDFKTWSDVPNGATSPVSVTAGSAHQFFRLHN